MKWSLKSIKYALKAFGDVKRHPVADDSRGVEAELVALKQCYNDHDQLFRMHESLLVCDSLEEAYSIIHVSAKALFPHLNGALAIYDKQSSMLTTVRQWGNERAMSPTFYTSACTALRLKKIYLVPDEKTHHHCQHVVQRINTPIIEWPWFIHHEPFGLLMFHGPMKQSIMKTYGALMSLFSEHARLALINLRLREQLQFQAIHDALTGLYNRRYLDAFMICELAKLHRHHRLLTLVMLDLDDFKGVNDHFGHDAGDEAIKCVASHLQHGVRASDVVCRLGGDEFVLVLSDSSLEHAQIRVQEICQRLKNHVLIHRGQSLPALSLSAGFAEAPRQGLTLNALLTVADHELYAVKRLRKEAESACLI